VDVDDRDAVVEILAEGPLNLLAQVLVREAITRRSALM
jgi:hypothetical protein